MGLGLGQRDSAGLVRSVGRGREVQVGGGSRGGEPIEELGDLTRMGLHATRGFEDDREAPGEGGRRGAGWRGPDTVAPEVDLVLSWRCGALEACGKPAFVCRRGSVDRSSGVVGFPEHVAGLGELRRGPAVAITEHRPLHPQVHRGRLAAVGPTGRGDRERPQSVLPRTHLLEQRGVDILATLVLVDLLRRTAGRDHEGKAPREVLVVAEPQTGDGRTLGQIEVVEDLLLVGGLVDVDLVEGEVGEVAVGLDFDVLLGQQYLALAHVEQPGLGLRAIVSGGDGFHDRLALALLERAVEELLVTDLGLDPIGPHAAAVVEQGRGKGVEQ